MAGNTEKKQSNAIVQWVGDFIRDIRKYMGLLLMALPTVILIFVLKYLPLPGMYLAFVKFRHQGGSFFYNLFNSEFVGLKNFQFLFSGKDTVLMFRNTIGYNLIFIFVGLVVTVAVAIMIHEMLNERVKKTFQTFMFLPYFLSWVVISYIALSFLSESGIINDFLVMMGKEPISFYFEPKYWPFILVIMNIWKGIGYGTVVYISALKGLDKALYEAAAIDGAKKWDQIKHITLPLLKPLMIILTILAVGGILNSDFGLFYHLPKNSGPLFTATHTLDVYVYKTFLLSGNVGLSAATGVFKSVVGFSIVMVTNMIVRKLDPEKSLF